MVSSPELDRLIEKGRQQGQLDIDDIRQALPIDRMEVGELSEVIARLEETGISVEIDAALLSSRRDGSLPHILKPEAQAPLPRSEQTPLADERSSKLPGSSEPERRNNANLRHQSRRTHFRLGATIVVAIMAILLVLVVVIWAPR